MYWIDSAARLCPYGLLGFQTLVSQDMLGLIMEETRECKRHRPIPINDSLGHYWPGVPPQFNHNRHLYHTIYQCEVDRAGTYSHYHTACLF